MEIELINERCKPKRAYKTDAGLDCYLNIDDTVMVKPHDVKVLPLGFKIDLKKGNAGIIKARSSIFQKGINIDGLIDSSYRGEVGVMIQNTTEKPHYFKPFDRICQLVPVRINTSPVKVVDKLNDTERGEGGFGSTGK